TNAVVDEYVARNFERARGNVNKAVAAIHEQIATLETELSEAEDARIETLQDSQIIDTESQQKITHQKLEFFSTQATDTNIELSRLEDTLKRVSQMRASGQDLMNLTELAADDTLQGLHREELSAEKDLEKAKVEYLPEHPAYETARNQLQAVRQRTQDRVDQLVGNMEAQAGLLRDRSRYLAAQVRDAEQYAVQMAKATSKYDVIRTDAETKKRIFDLISTTMNEVQLQAELMN